MNTINAVAKIFIIIILSLRYKRKKIVTGLANNFYKSQSACLFRCRCVVSPKLPNVPVNRGTKYQEVACLDCYDHVSFLMALFHIAVSFHHLVKCIGSVNDWF